MAGAGYKLFNTGDVLTAAQVNTYLQEQTVMVFANATARTTALSGVLAEGMVTYLKDTDALEIYSGSAWVGYGSGDITGITTGATSGLTGGATSGTADLKLNTTAKGGLLVGTGSGTVSELAVGTNNYVLTADSSTATGLKWAASGGKVLQVVSAVYSTQTDITSTTMTDTGLSVSITPSSASSKVLILVSQQLMFYRTAKQAAGGLRLLRGASEIFEVAGTSTVGLIAEGTGWTDSYYGSSFSLVYLDSPATTSATTYKTQANVKSTLNSGTVSAQYASADSSIIALEIGA